ncbi:MAG: hypothetical protein AMJ55_11795 [Gammaproteobacteria bacterium SG8_15]|nr:MAG: hypothetical protein AMJ55_11795 [Gammaproteobacteria bacterium SG8_15]
MIYWFNLLHDPGKKIRISNKVSYTMRMILIEHVALTPFTDSFNVNLGDPGANAPGNLKR